MCIIIRVRDRRSEIDQHVTLARRKVGMLFSRDFSRCDVLFYMMERASWPAWAVP